MSTEFTWKQKLQYRFDNIMSRGPLAMIGLLALASLFIVLIAGCIISIFGISPEGEESLGFIEGTWRSLMATLDPGTMGGDSGWSFRWVRFLVTLGGIFVISTLIGVLGSGIEGKLYELRKGRSHVIEHNHTLILGWSHKVFYIISELILANENQKNAHIVVMSTKDKVEMEDEINQRITDFKTTMIICRSASPADLYDLNIVNPEGSKSIIILSEDTVENPDANVIKTILALTNNPNRKSSKKYHIVAEIENERNVIVAKMVGKDEVEVVLSADVISSIMVQTCRQSGLSGVYTDLLDYDGDEIYFISAPSLVGKSFYDIIMSYETSCIIGLYRANNDILLNPPMDTIMIEGDELIAISEDDDTIQIAAIRPIIQREYILDEVPIKATPEKILILGWNNRGAMMVHKMDHYVSKDSLLTIIGNKSESDYGIDILKNKLQNIQLQYTQGDITNRELLDSLNIIQYNHSFILSYSDEYTMQEADSITLITLLHLRNIGEIQERQISVASEMMDVNNRELAKITRADDFIVSENYIALMLSQISENKILNRIFAQLFSTEGSEISIKPIRNYVAIDKPMSFYTVVAAAAAKGEIAIGYKIAAERNDAAANYGIYNNPKKSETITFAAEDRVIVLAEF